MDTADIWIGIIIPLFVGPICIFLKYLWDRYDEEIKLKSKINFDENLSKVKTQLSIFYWPIYIKLICVYQMNYNLPLNDEEDKLYDSCSSSDDESLNQGFKRCACYIEDDIGPNKCNKKIPHNGSNICRECRWSKLKKTIKIHKLNNRNFKKIFELHNNNLVIENDLKISKFNDNDNDNDNNNDETNIKIVIDTVDSSDDESLTGEGIGTVKELPLITLNLDANTINNIKHRMFEIYQELYQIIKNNISIAEPTTKMGKELIKFLKFIEIYCILHKSNHNYKITDFEATNNTNKLLSLIEINVFALQKEYNTILELGPFTKKNKTL